jgi:hypothetical protein
MQTRKHAHTNVQKCPSKTVSHTEFHTPVEAPALSCVREQQFTSRINSSSPRRSTVRRIVCTAETMTATAVRY